MWVVVVRADDSKRESSEQYSIRMKEEEKKIQRENNKNRAKTYEHAFTVFPISSTHTPHRAAARTQNKIDVIGGLERLHQHQNGDSIQCKPFNLLSSLSRMQRKYQVEKPPDTFTRSSTRESRLKSFKAKRKWFCFCCCRCLCLCLWLCLCIPANTSNCKYSKLFAINRAFNWLWIDNTGQTIRLCSFQSMY